MYKKRISNLEIFFFYTIFLLEILTLGHVCSKEYRYIFGIESKKCYKNKYRILKDII